MRMTHCVSIFYYFLCLFVTITQSKNQKDVCINFKADEYKNIQFVTITLGTPLVPYRLMVCVQPKVENLVMYSVVLFKDNFGGNSIILSTDESYLTKGNNFATKSASFEESYRDEYSIIGNDMLRSTEGSWVRIGIEIPILGTEQELTDSFCNPGGVGDSWKDSYDSKYGRFDGYFVISSTTRLIYDQSINIGYSLLSIKNAIITYCYFEQNTHLIENYVNRNIDRFALYGKLESDNKLEKKGSPLYNIYSHNTNKKIFQYGHVPFVYNADILDVSQSVLSPLLVSSNTKNPKLQTIYTNSLELFNVSFVTNKKIDTNLLSDFYKSGSYYHPEKNQIQGGHNWGTRFRSNSITKNFHTKSIQKDNLKIRYLLNQPYNYLPRDIFENYLENKNFILDIPDEHWESICFKSAISSKSSCLGATSLVKSAFLTQRKNGRISYFPKSYSSSLKGASESIVSNLVLHGGRQFGHTMRGNDAEQLMTTDHARTKAYNTFLQTQDAYFINSIKPKSIKYQYPPNRYRRISNNNNNESSTSDDNRIKLQEIFDTSVLQADEVHSTAKLNRLLLLPHNGPSDTVYLGTTSLKENSLDIKYIINHTSSEINLMTTSAKGFEVAFLTTNDDISDGESIFYFMLNLLYAITIITSIFKLRSICVRYFFMQEFVVDMETTQINRRSGNDNNNLRPLDDYFMRKVWISDLFMQLLWFIIFFILLIVFGWRSFIIFADSSAIISGISAFSIYESKGSVSILSLINADVARLFISTFILSLVVAISSLIFLILVYCFIKSTGSDLGSTTTKVKNSRTERFKKILSIFLGYVHDNAYTASLSYDRMDEDGTENDIYMIKKNDNYDVIEQEASLQISFNILHHILGIFMSIIFFTSSMHIIMLSSNSSTILRFWNLIGFFVELYISTYALLFLIFVARFIFYFEGWSHSNSDKEENNKTGVTILQTTKKFYPRMKGSSNMKKRMNKCLCEKDSFSVVFFILGSFVFFMLSFVSALVALAIYIVPFELEAVNGDYSGTTIEYIISFTVVLVIVTLANELWDYSWKNKDGELFVKMYQRSKVFNEMIKNNRT